MAWDDDAMDDPAAVPQGIDGATADGVDELAVQRAVDGIRTDLTPTERDLALPRMASAGMSDPAIARVLGINAETVYRNRSRLGVPTAVPSPTARTRRAS
jgi:DNA-binding NarL/FixJ family response regulator